MTAPILFSLFRVSSMLSVLVVVAAFLGNSASGAEKSPPHLLLITVDDMSCDSVGVFGCKLPETTPSIDAFAQTALRFQHAHVQVGNCMPGRNIMWSGMYSFRNGVEGFRMNRNPGHPMLCEIAKSAGYLTAIRGKASHSSPYHPYPGWTVDLTQKPDGGTYDSKYAVSYGTSTRRAFEMAQAAG
ncbi:MAG: sulfatase-like hydrolase/transferase, partial [Planctomycetota bacterium]